MFNYRSESLTMHFDHWKLVVVAAFAVGGMGAAHAQNAIEQLQPLVETTAHRLMIGEQVALAKWDSGKAVEDAPREAQVILGAVKDGAAKGLDETSVSNFFNAQIEANKSVQYALLGDWYRAGVSLDVVGRAFLLGCARKYVTLFNHQGGSPVTSLHYFAGIVEETAAMDLNLNYWRYLAARVKKMDAQWRAQANFTRAAGSNTPETK